MRNPLRKRYLRELKRNLGRYISIFLMLMVTIALMSGFLAVSDGALEALIQNRKDSKQEDGQFSSYSMISTDAIKNIEKLGISVYENYYVDEDIDEDMNENINVDTVLRIYNNRENINLVTAMKGKLPEDDDEIAIERLFAETNNIAIGDLLNLFGKDMKITGYVCMPDYSSLFEKNSDLMMDAFHFGIGIVTEEAFNQLSKNNMVYNYSYYYNDRSLTESKKRDLSNKILDTLVINKALLKNFCTAENNNSITFIDDDLQSDVPLMKVLLNIIIVIMAFVYSIVISSTIDAEAPVIGTLLASGYGKYDLIRHYMGLPVIVTFISAVVGNLLGYTVMPIVFKDMYYGSYSVPAMQIKPNAEALFLTTVLPILIMICINFVTLNHKLSISPLNFLRRELKKRNKKRAIRLPNLSFFNRFRMRIVLQNKSNYIILFIGIFFASVILLFGLSIKPLIEHYVDSINKTTIAKYQYILKAPTGIKYGETEEKFTITSLETYFKQGNKNLEVSFYGIIEDSRYMTELLITDDMEGAYFSDGLVKKLKLKSGDVVSFKDPYSGDEYKIKVKGSYDYPAGLAVFMSQSQLNSLREYENAYFNGYFSNDELGFDTENNLLTVITPEDMAELGDQMVSSFKQLAPLCLGIAVIIYMVLMYILTKIVIDKNAIYISFMKVFGYTENEIRKLYLTTTNIVVVISLIVSLPLVHVAISVCYEAVLMKISGYIPVFIPIYLYIEIVVIGLVSYLAINYLHKKRVYKIQMAAALKNRE